MTGLAPKAEKFFEERGISSETVIRMGVYSGRRVTTGDESRVEPATTGELIVFPFIERGEVVAEKYRAPGKRFSQRPNPRSTFYNSDILDDPRLHDGSAALVITEGEMDCLACVDAGYPFAVSVPDGAPPARDKDGNLIRVADGTADIDPTNDNKFQFVANNWDRLSRIKRITIAVDSDEPGRRLAAELVRRLGRVRCSFVTFPIDCKDANEVLMQHGAPKLVETIAAAKPYPVSGVYRFFDLPQEPALQPVTTGWGRLDQHLLAYFPALLIITGLANHGKSAWANQLVAQLAALHGWNIAIASFEMRIRPFVTDVLTSVYLGGKSKRLWNELDLEDASAWIDRRFAFIAPEPDCEAVHDVGWLIEKAEVAVIRHGARVLVIDPWNEIEHSRRRDESVTEYTNRALRELKDFGRRFDVLVIIVAHPTKSATNKSPEELSLYDVSDSAAFQNKADLGVVVARLGDLAIDNLTGVYVRKVRYQPTTGAIGAIELTFDREAGLFSQ